MHVAIFQTLSVNQGPRTQYGADYPFVAPPDAVRYLLGDLWLIYPDDAVSYVWPLQVISLTGFNSGTGPQNMIIADANGDEIIDTSTADSAQVNPWGNNLQTLTWIKGEIVLRCTMRLVPPPWDPTRTWAADITTNAILDPRTYERLPRRVRSIIVGLQSFNAVDLVLSEGFNINLEVLPNKSQDGGRQVTGIKISANPGDGLGQAPGCRAVVAGINQINDIGPDTNGNFTLDAGGCYRLQRPTRLISSTPRSVSLYSPSLTNTQAAAALWLFNDCGPCCTCQDFVDTYEGLRLLTQQYRKIGQTAQSARDAYAANIARWDAQQACRIANAIRLVLQPEPNGGLFVGGLLCNASTCCIVPLVLRTTFEYFRDGSPLFLSPDVDCQESRRAGTDTDYEEVLYQPVNHFPVMDTYFDRADAQAVSRFRNRMQFGALAGDTVRVTLTSHMPPIYDAAGNPCPLPTAASVDVPEDVKAIWATYPPPYPVRAIVQKTSPVSPTAGCCQ